MRLLKLALAILIGVAIAGPAFAQGVTAAAAVAALAGAGGWSEFISVTLGQLLTASGIGVGGIGGGTVVFQVVKWLIAHRGQIQASTEAIKAATAGKADESQINMIDQLALEVMKALLGAKQTAQPGQPAPAPTVPLSVDSNDVEKAVSLFKTALAGHGLTLDSDVIRGKIHAALGDIALKLPPLPSLPFPLPFTQPAPVPKPNPAQAAATQVLTATGGAAA